MNSDITLTARLQSNGFWQPFKGGFAESESFSGTPAMYARVYTEADFAAIDPRLVKVLPTHGKQVSTIFIRRALDYWANPERVLPMLEPRTRNIIGKHHVAFFTSFWSEPSRADVVVEFHEYRLGDTDGILYPTGAHYAEVCVPKDWLGKHYPNWEPRYHTALALGLSSFELTHFITSTENNMPHIDVNGLTF